MENAAIERIWELITRKIAGEATGDELQELQELLQQHPEEAYSMEIMAELWKIPIQENKNYSEYQFRQLIQRMKNMGMETSGFQTEEDPDVSVLYDTSEAVKSPARKWRKMAFISAGLASIFSIVFFIYPTLFKGNQLTIASKLNKPVELSEIITKEGSKTSIVLPDGTKVWVNSGSKLTYDRDFGEKIREVTLSGEAYFDVVHNAVKPFIIHTVKMDIKVLGTAFNVRCYPDEKKTETSLIRGRIEVTLLERPKEKIYLKPNDKLILSNDNNSAYSLVNKSAKTETVAGLLPMVSISHITYQQTDSSVVETSWVENKLEFVGETFEDIAKKMERWYGVMITINDEKLKQTHLTGSFEHETVEQALIALQISVPFKYTNTQNNIVITK